MGVAWLTAFIDLPADGFGTGYAFWQQATASGPSASRGDHGQWATLVPPEGDAYLCAQRTEGTQPGVHLDVHTDDVGALAEHAEGAGALNVARHEGWAVLQSPGGLSFCTVPVHGQPRRPPPVAWPGGHHSLVDQVCVDIPPLLFEAEVAFWATLTGWESRPSATHPEFAALARPAGIALRLLLQRLDAPGSGVVRAHLDLACDNVAAEVERHHALGATTVRDAGRWTTLADTAGMEYCVTSRGPVTGMPNQA